MAYAMAYPEDGGVGGRGNKSPAQGGGLRREDVRQARLVLKWAPKVCGDYFNRNTFDDGDKSDEKLNDDVSELVDATESTFA
jgi:hypothetical protein